MWPIMQQPGATRYVMTVTVTVTLYYVMIAAAFDWETIWILSCTATGTVIQNVLNFTLNANPFRKSRGVKRPPTGRNVKPVLHFKYSLTS